jgi:hypothetical protein
VLFTAPKAGWLHLVGSSVLAPEAMPDVVAISPDTRVHRIKISILQKVSEVRTFNNESIVCQAPPLLASNNERCFLREREGSGLQGNQVK